MAITRGAKKAIRVQARRRTINERKKKALKSAEKNLRKVISTGKRAVAEGLLSGAYKAIDKAAKRGIIKKNTAARKKSRLARAIGKIAGE